MDIKNNWLQLQIKFADFIVKKFFIILSLIIIIVLGLGFYVVFYPKYRLYDLQIEVELPQQMSSLTMEEAKLENLQSTEIEFSKFKDSLEIQKLTKFLPSKKDVGNLFVYLEAISKEARFDLKNVSLSEDLSGKITLDNDNGDDVQTEAVIHKVRASLNFEGGSYDSMKQMLEIIEGSLKIMDINSLSFSPNLEGKTGYMVTLTTYYIEE